MYAFPLQGKFVFISFCFGIILQIRFPEGDQRMNFRSLASPAIVVTAMLAALLIGCVDIPSEGHTPPDYKASVRVMYLDPAITGTANLTIADGPNFDTFRSDVLPAGSFGDVTAYSTINAGGKQLFVNPGDTDTSTVTVATDFRGSLIVLPRPDVSMNRFLLLGEGRTFEEEGVHEGSQVRFVNAVARGTADTLDVTVDVHVLPDSSVVVEGLVFGDISDAVLVDVDSTASFYLTREGSTTPLTGSTAVTGAAHSDYAFIGQGTADAASLESHPNE
jgi:hypothetical protein